MYKIGISLSGGGARGIAHLGVLQALHDRSLEPEIVSGTSMGAIIGALYASGSEPRAIFDEIKKDDHFWNIYALSRPRLGFGNQKITNKILSKFIAKNDFTSLKKPLYISVTNLNLGTNEIINSGDKLFETVMASASIPIIFQPIEINKMLYVDGGITDNMPLEVLRSQCKFLIGSHVNHLDEMDGIKNLASLADRVFQISVFNTIRDHLSQCDLFVDPPELKDFSILNFHKTDELFNIGYQHTLQLIDSTDFSQLKKSFWQRIFISDKKQHDLLKK